MHNKDLNSVVEYHALPQGQFLDEKKDLILADPLYNVPCGRNDENVVYHRPSTSDTEHFVNCVGG